MATADINGMFDDVEVELNASEGLLIGNALTVAEVQATLTRTLQYISNIVALGSIAGGDAQIAALQGQLSALQGYAPDDLDPASLWPAQRQVIEAAYIWAGADSARTNLDAAQAQADASVLDSGVKKLVDGIEQLPKNVLGGIPFWGIAAVFVAAAGLILIVSREV